MTIREEIVNLTADLAGEDGKIERDPFLFDVLETFVKLKLEENNEAERR